MSVSGDLSWRRETLGNGLRLTIVRQPHARSVSIWACVPGGCTCETAETNGVTHLVEHLHFATTLRHPTRIELTRALDRAAMYSNAMVNTEGAHFVMSTHPAWAREAVELLAECLAIRDFSDEIIESERRLLRAELQTSTEPPVHPALLRMYANHPYGLPPGGTPKSVRRLTRRQIFDFQARAFAPDGISVAIAGAVDEATVSAAREALGALRPTGAERLVAADPPAIRLPIYLRVRGAASAGASMIFALPAPASVDEFNACRLVSMGMSSISSGLMENLRYRLGSIYAYQANFAPHGRQYLFSVSAGLRARDRDVFLERVARELTELAAGERRPDWFETARRHALVSVEHAYEDPRALAYQAAWETSSTGLREPASLADDVRWLESVTHASLSATVRRLFVPERLVVCFSPRLRLLDTQRLRRTVERVLATSGGD